MMQSASTHAVDGAADPGWRAEHDDELPHGLPPAAASQQQHGGQHADPEIATSAGGLLDADLVSDRPAGGVLRAAAHRARRWARRHIGLLVGLAAIVAVELLVLGWAVYLPVRGAPGCPGQLGRRLVNYLLATWHPACQLPEGRGVARGRR